MAAAFFEFIRTCGRKASIPACERLWQSVNENGYSVRHCCRQSALVERIQVKCGAPRIEIRSVNPLFQRDTSVRHSLNVIGQVDELHELLPSGMLIQKQLKSPLKV